MPMHTARDLLAEAREHFLAAEPVDPDAVRKPILASWWRSRQWHVAADHIELDYLRDPDLESNLAGPTGESHLAAHPLAFVF